MALVFPTEWDLQCNAGSTFTASHNALSRFPCSDGPAIQQISLTKSTFHNLFNPVIWDTKAGTIWALLPSTADHFG